MVDSEGKAVADARVFVTPLEEDPKSQTSRLTRSTPPEWPDLAIEPVLTDRSGEFHFPRTPATSHQIRAVAEGTLYSVSQVLDGSDLGPVTLELQALPATEAIQGQVIDATGAPLSDVLICLLPGDSPGKLSDAVAETETSEDGTSSIQARDWMTYQIRAEDLLDRWDNVTVHGVKPGSTRVEVRFVNRL